jgi:hypothetical protein
MALLCSGTLSILFLHRGVRWVLASGASRLLRLHYTAVGSGRTSGTRLPFILSITLKEKIHRTSTHATLPAAPHDHPTPSTPHWFLPPPGGQPFILSTTKKEKIHHTTTQRHTARSTSRPSNPIHPPSPLPFPIVVTAHCCHIQHPPPLQKKSVLKNKVAPSSLLPILLQPTPSPQHGGSMFSRCLLERGNLPSARHLSRKRISLLLTRFMRRSDLLLPSQISCADQRTFGNGAFNSFS